MTTTTLGIGSSRIELNDVLSSLLARLEVDNGFHEPQLQSQSTAGSYSQTSSARRLLQPSLSLPVDSLYQELTNANPGELSLLPTATVATPRMPERRSQSITDATSWSMETTDMQAKQSAAAAPARYKTELCRPFEENGTCRYGSKCQFAHGRAELRSVVRHPKYKTDLCRTFHTTGLCPYGPRCHFIHNDEERRSADEQTAMVMTTGKQVQAVQQRDDVGRSLSSSGLPDHENRHSTRLHRQYSEYQPRSEVRAQRGVLMAGHGAVGGELQRRASSVADSVIRHSRQSPYQQHLRTVLDSDPALSMNISSTPSLGSVADSFSPSSSVTDSPSPSPTSGLLLPTGDDCSPPTAMQCPTVAVPPPRWPASDDLLAQLIARLGPQEVATLILALKQQQGATQTSYLPAANTTTIRGLDTTDAGTPSWQQDIWTQYHQMQRCQQQQQQPQRAAVTSNVCW